MDNDFKIEDYLGEMSIRIMEEIRDAINFIGEHGDESALPYLSSLKGILFSVSDMVSSIRRNLDAYDAIHQAKNVVDEFLKVNTIQTFKDILKNS